ncbi:MAG: ABC transporter permease [Promethearchaeota archaeon]
MSDNQVIDKQGAPEIYNFNERIKNYLFQWLKSPFLIIGTVLVVFVILVAFFPQILTPYTLEETLDIYPSPEYPDQVEWMKPSKDHPLGTTKYGRDLLAVISWGTRDTLLVGFGAAFIGLIGGAPFGFMTRKFNLKVYQSIMALMIIAFIIPALILVLILTTIFGETNTIITVTLGILLIPSFTRVIAKVAPRQDNLKKISKTVISYIPLNAALAILIYVAIAFLGFIDPSDWGLPQLAYYIAQARAHIQNAPHAIFWPGFAIFLILIGLFFLHEGLKDLLQ